MNFLFFPVFSRPSNLAHMKCPHCQFPEMQVKAGRNRTGSQRYLCRACGRFYTPEPKAAGYDESKRRMVLQLYAACTSVRRAARLYAKVSTQTAANWIRVAVAEARREMEGGTMEPGSLLSHVLAESRRREYEEAARLRRSFARGGGRKGRLPF